MDDRRDDDTAIRLLFAAGEIVDRLRLSDLAAAGSRAPVRADRCSRAIYLHRSVLTACHGPDGPGGKERDLASLVGAGRADQLVMMRCRGRNALPHWIWQSGRFREPRGW